MKFKTLLTGLAASMAISAYGTAYGATNNLTTSPGTWSNGAHWSDGVPTEDDHVVLDANESLTVDVTNAVCGTLNLGSNSAISISASKVLTVDGLSSVGSAHAINGTVTLAGSGSVLLFIDRDQTISGSGSIIGQDAAAQIQIEDTFKLTSKMKIEGMMEMQPDFSTGATSTAKFENARTSSSEEGQVVANANGAFKFNQYLIIDDTSFTDGFGTVHRPLYKADSTGSYVNNKLQFNRLSDESHATNNPRLVGRFQVVDCGTVEYLATVETRGGLTLTSGRVLTNGAGAPVFRYNWLPGPPPTYTEISDSSSAGGCS
jgi:hypothetical protein